MASNSQPNIASLSDEKQKKLKEGMKQIDGSLTRVLGERTFIKETISRLADETGLDKKLIRKLAKTVHKASYKMDVQENETFDELYNTLYSGA
jgi:hypothetical protein